MGLDIFFIEDIRNAILAANEASSDTAAVAISQDTQLLDAVAAKLRTELTSDTGQTLLDVLYAAAVSNVNAIRFYRKGYRAALITLALAFGLSPALVEPETLALPGRKS